MLHPLLSGKLHNNDKWPQDKLPYRRHIIQETETGKRDKCTSMYFIENNQAIASKFTFTKKTFKVLLVGLKHKLPKNWLVG